MKSPTSGSRTGFTTTSTDQRVAASPDGRTTIFTPERAPRQGHTGFTNEHLGGAFGVHRDARL